MINTMEKLLVLGIAIILGILLTLGSIWIFWKLYIFVIPSLFPTGADTLIHPSYWVFVGEWSLFWLIARVIRGSKDE